MPSHIQLSEIFVSISITQAVYYLHLRNSNYMMHLLSSGLKDLTWEQFTGCTIAPATSAADNGFAAYNGWQRNAYSGTGATADSLGFKQIPTTGTILVLDMGLTIQLPQEFDAPGNIGQFSLQVICTAANQHKYAWNANEYELVVLVVNPGF
jgi:hypothetical protein